MISLHSLLSNPYLYLATKKLLASDKTTRMFVEMYLHLRPDDNVLDLGCGPADILDFLPDVTYYGIDINPKYIDAARKRFGDRGTFVRKKVNKYALEKDLRFDLVLAKGLLHHLNDIEAVDMFELARSHLNNGGRLVTFDGCYVPDQSCLAKRFLSMDRGKHVRTEERYMELASHLFPNVIPTIRHDLLRIPYTILIMECTR